MPRKKKNETIPEEEDVKNYKLTKEEQELVINMDRAGNCEIYTSWPKHIQKLKEYARLYPDDYEITREDECSIVVKVNPKHIVYKKPYSKA